MAHMHHMLALSGNAKDSLALVEQTKQAMHRDKEVGTRTYVYIRTPPRAMGTHTCEHCYCTQYLSQYQTTSSKQGVSDEVMHACIWHCDVCVA